jgi:hypothetical protein
MARPLGEAGPPWLEESDTRGDYGGRGCSTAGAPAPPTEGLQ